LNVRQREEDNSVKRSFIFSLFTGHDSGDTTREGWIGGASNKPKVKEKWICKIYAVNPKERRRFWR
jgi:hypothetical protein